MLSMNPHDNHGFRTDVLASYIMRNRLEDAFTLIARFPNDQADFEYTRLLALSAAGRLKEADAAAKVTLKKSPNLAKMLVATSPKQPKMDDRGYQLGSTQEAWIYRDSFLSVWQAQTGALAWLASMARTK